MINIYKVKDIKDLKKCSDLRKSVFKDEEAGPDLLYIIDEYDKMESTCNYILEVDVKPISTVRFIKIDEDTIKLQRLVVLKEYRKMGYANMILKYLEEDATNLGYKIIIGDAALKSVGFYKKNGYKELSDVFYEDNRPHIKMEKKLTKGD